MKKRFTRMAALLAAIVTAIAMTAGPASAQKLIGCDSKIEWPCPGPAL